MDVSKFTRGGAFLLIVLVDTCLAFGEALHRTKLAGHDTHDVDVFIEQKLGYIHAKIDLRPTKDGLLTLEKAIFRLEKSKTNNLSRVLAKNLDTKFDRIVAKLYRVDGSFRSENHRQTRSIDTIGNLISDLFGNPGPNDWKKNTANVLAMQTAIQKLSENTRTEYNDIDMNRHSIEKQNDEIRALNTMVGKNQIEIGKIDEEMYTLTLYFEVVALADAVAANVDSLIEVKMDSLKGYCSEKAVDKQFLVENLQAFEANKVGLGPIFGSWEWREYYKNPMCAFALHDEAVWVTLRVPLVSKAERLVRVIPAPSMKLVLDRVKSYGLEILLFREKANDKFHVMTMTSFEFCNKLGNTRTCGARDVRFGPSQNVVIPVEFARNRILLVSTEQVEIKMMSKCIDGIFEHMLVTDAVLLVPDNCSYISNSLSIAARESDTQITTEIGLAQIAKFEVDKVENVHWKVTTAEIQKLSHNVSRSSFDRMNLEIRKELDKIDVKHESMWETYKLERWGLGGVLLVAFCVIAGAKVLCWARRRRNRGIVNYDSTTKQPRQRAEQQQQQQLTQDEFEMTSTAELPTQQQPTRQLQTTQQQTTQQQHQLQQQQQQQARTDKRQKAEHDYDEIDTTRSVSFGLPPENSQFFKKN